MRAHPHRLLAAACIVALAVTVAACGEDEPKRSPARTDAATEEPTPTDEGPTTPATTTDAEAPDPSAPIESYPARPKNLRITAEDRADLLDVANAWKRTHERSWGAGGTKFVGKELGAPLPGDVYDSGWLEHEYAYASFPLEGWPLENSLLFVRDADVADEDTQWRVLRHDISTDVSGVCSLPTPLVGLWYRETGTANGCAPLGAPAGAIEAASLARSPRLVQSTDGNVRCLLELSEERVQVACARVVRPVGAALGEGEPEPTSSRRNATQLIDALFDSSGATNPRGTTLGLDDHVRVTRRGTEVLRCTSPAGTGITCTTPGGGTLDLGPTGDPA
ncbi:MAG: hypothetical protein JWM86_1849 [Thermoleophilia bacterium]|nr:hypothetical protein [Thermoleophilia bacterium]